jgi:hypothetical protein
MSPHPTKPIHQRALLSTSPRRVASSVASAREEIQSFR